MKFINMIVVLVNSILNILGRNLTMAVSSSELAILLKFQSRELNLFDQLCHHLYCKKGKSYAQCEAFVNISGEIRKIRFLSLYNCDGVQLVDNADRIEPTYGWVHDGIFYGKILGRRCIADVCINSALVLSGINYMGNVEHDRRLLYACSFWPSAWYHEHCSGISRQLKKHSQEFTIIFNTPEGIRQYVICDLRKSYIEPRWKYVDPIEVPWVVPVSVAETIDWWLRTGHTGQTPENLSDMLELMKVVDFFGILL